MDRNHCFATFFRPKKHMSKYHCHECFESDGGKNLNLEILKIKEFQFQDDSIFCLALLFGLIDFFLVRHGGSPLCFPVVVVMLRLPRDIPPPKAWWHSLFRQRARAFALASAHSCPETFEIVARKVCAGKVLSHVPSPACARALA